MGPHGAHPSGHARVLRCLSGGGSGKQPPVFLQMLRSFFKNRNDELKLLMGYRPFCPLWGSVEVAVSFSVSLGRKCASFWEKVILYMKPSAARKVMSL